MSRIYSWADVAARTAAVYDRVTGSEPDAASLVTRRVHPQVIVRCCPSSHRLSKSLLHRLTANYRLGAAFGKLCCFILALNTLYLIVLDRLEPPSSFDVCAQTSL